MLKYCHMAASVFACLVFVVLMSASQVSAQDTEDSRLFLSGFNAYQQQDYTTAVASLNEVLQKYPDTPLRDMTLFWLARAHFKAGNQQEAARFMARFSREYPDNPLRQTAEEELQALAARYEQQYPAGSEPADVKAVAAEKERQQREEAERRRLAARAAEERAAREKAEAAQRAETERIARDKIAAEQATRLKAEREAAEHAEQARLQKAEEERLVRERQAREEAERQRLAVARAEKEREAAEKARLQKAEDDRLARERAERTALAKAEAGKKAEQQAATHKAAAAEQQRQALREKAIAEYKGILERYPDSPAAQTAVNRLKALGVTVAQPQPRGPVPTPPAADAQVLTLEVAQYAAFEFNPALPLPPVEVAKPTALPFEIVNRGNGRDSFYLASGFPKEFGVRFVAETAPEQSINQTPPLSPGEAFKGRMILTIPAATIDGLRMTYPIRAASQYTAEASQSREIALTASAPLLRAVVKTDKTHLTPGERTHYLVTVLNVGSAVARDVTLRINHPPQLDPLEPTAGGLRQEMKAALVLDGIQLKPGERRDVVIPFTVREDALAREELMVRADLINTPLQTRSSFLSNIAHVQPLSAVAVQVADSRITTIPGQVVRVPVTVVNRGNLRESFTIVADVPSSRSVAIYHDLNRDGSRQADEPEITAIGPLGPREEAALLLEITTPGSAQDGSEAGISISVAPQSGNGKPTLATSRMIFSRPVVQLAMKGRDGRLIPGELLTVELAVVNQGSNLARLVEVATTWPEQMELVATEAATQTASGGVTWRFTELGAGEKRLVKASFRIKPNTVVGTGLQLKSTLSYQDQLGNRY